MGVTPERTREERIETYYHESARSLATDLVDAEDKAERAQAAVRLLMGCLRRTEKRERRYRLAWLSARRRAVDEFNHGGEALERKAQEIADLSAELRRHREFVVEVQRVRGKAMVDLETATDLMESHLRPVYESLRELEDAQRERRPFVPRMEREYGALRESTYGAPQECVSVEGGSVVWRLEDGRLTAYLTDAT
ncbi:hypothetical protein [Streptomyces sp. NRRL S-378]|uniref:hypothetical protein n=1 Tax=Streptomyces sp. NRRL S-378 TaxID=1463904 RepID=UPI000566B0CC|nr:hypothetical protein [Streptomyces sp. NRRL S-378]